MIPQLYFFYFIGQMDTNDLINRLPETVKIRARHVFAAVLDYIFDTLTMDLVLRLPPDLTYKVPEVRNKKQIEYLLQFNHFHKIYFDYHFIKEFERKFYMTVMLYENYQSLSLYNSKRFGLFCFV